jgi:hypothetical protein
MGEGPEGICPSYSTNRLFRWTKKSLETGENWCNQRIHVWYVLPVQTVKLEAWPDQELVQTVSMQSGAPGMQ